MNLRQGFTLLELLIVMGIMALLMGISALSFMGLRRGAELRGATMTVRTTLMLARQQAVTKRQNMKVIFNSASNSIMAIYGATGLTNKTIYLTPGVEFAGSSVTLTFSPSGRVVGGAQPPPITVQEKPSLGTQKRTIKVWMLTGATTES